MNKVVLFSLSMVVSLTLFSCKKCAECSVKENNFYDGEYCKGSSFENIIYEDAKEECGAMGGEFK